MRVTMSEMPSRQYIRCCCVHVAIQIVVDFSPSTNCLAHLYLQAERDPCRLIVDILLLLITQPNTLAW